MRLGLVGYSAPTGLGELNRQINKYLPIEKWLVVRHSKYGAEMLHEHMTTDIDEFTDAVDVVIFCETPFRYRFPSKRVVCVPMLEWTPRDAEWMEDVDLFICPTSQCFVQLTAERRPCSWFPWPWELEKFTFCMRDRCERFLFVEGNGGSKGRKGSKYIRQALELWPEMPLTVCTQSGTKWPSSVEVVGRCKDNSELYDHGDVLLYPHTVDGLGLEMREAMASGMPVVATDGEPWNEVETHMPRIRSAKSSRSFPYREVDWYEPNAENIVEVCSSLVGSDIRRKSIEANTYAMLHSWEVMGQFILDLVFGTKIQQEVGEA